MLHSTAYWNAVTSSRCTSWMAVSAVHDVVDLLQCVLGATLHAEVVNDKQGITTELVHNIVPPGKAAVQLVQDLGKVCHAHRHLLLHQSVCNAPGKETFAGAHTAPEKKPKVLCTHGLPLLHIAMCSGCSYYAG